MGLAAITMGFIILFMAMTRAKGAPVMLQTLPQEVFPGILGIEFKALEDVGTKS